MLPDVSRLTSVIDSLIRLVGMSLRVDGSWWNERGWRGPAVIEGGEQNGASRAIKGLCKRHSRPVLSRKDHQRHGVPMG